MTAKFKETSIKYLSILIVLTVIIIITFLVGLTYLIKNKFIKNNIYHKKLGYIFLGISLLTLISTYISFFVINYELDKDLQINSSKDNFEEESTSLRYSIEKENNKIKKKLRPLIILKEGSYKFDNEFTELSNKSNIFSNKINNKTTLFNISLFSIMYYYRWKAIKLREQYSKENEYFVKTYNLNENDCSWEEEYIPYSLKEYDNINKEKIKLQLRELNKFLESKNYNIIDFHGENVRLNYEGDIKVIDGELLKDFEIFLSKNIINCEKQVFNNSKILTNNSDIEDIIN